MSVVDDVPADLSINVVSIETTEGALSID